MRVAIVACVLAASASTAVASDESADGELPLYSQGWYAAFGVGWLPAGVDGPSDASAELLQGGVAIRWRQAEVRFSGVLAFESTSYQSSTSGMALARTARYFSPHFSIGAGLGLGVGSFTPKDGFNADNGMSPELIALLTPVTAHFGPIEIGVDVGVLQLTSFSETDYFYQLSIGYVHW
jgi:hypothetical protein